MKYYTYKKIESQTYRFALKPYAPPKITFDFNPPFDIWTKDENGNFVKHKLNY